ncbi:MAG: hypothetical protein WC356_05620 [Candidatus Micrarchaeia archaeon]
MEKCSQYQEKRGTTARMMIVNATLSTRGNTTTGQTPTGGDKMHTKHPSTKGGAR